MSSGSQSIWQAKGQKQEREIENPSSCRKSFAHWRNSKNPRPHGGVQTWCVYGMGLTHSLSPAGSSRVGWKGGGGVGGRPKAVIGCSAKIFTTLPELGYDEIAETDFACQSFQSLFFSWGLWPPFYDNFFFFPPDTHKHTHSSLRHPPPRPLPLPLCVSSVLAEKYF